MSRQFKTNRRQIRLVSEPIHISSVGRCSMPSAPATKGPAEPPVTLDDVDRRIVAALVADGRLSINELASRVGVSRATAYARLDRLRANGVITGFTAKVDPAKVGHGVAAL